MCIAAENASVFLGSLQDCKRTQARRRNILKSMFLKDQNDVLYLMLRKFGGSTVPIHI